jgi:hypothetical protein
LRRFLVLTAALSALLAWREHKLAENEQRFAPATVDGPDS